MYSPVFITSQALLLSSKLGHIQQLYIPLLLRIVTIIKVTFV